MPESNKARGAVDWPARQTSNAGPDPRFERITRTARRLLGMPIAYVSVMEGESQWFKSQQGLEAAALPQCLAFCAQTMGCDAPFIVEDAAADPLGKAPYIRFYAGAALHDSTGLRIGTIAVLDRIARTLSADQLDILRDLAQWAESEFDNPDMRQALLVAQENESRLNAMVDSVSDGIITLDQYGLIASLNRAATRIFGFQPEEVIGQNIKVLMPTSYHQAHDGYLQNFRDTGKTRVIGMDRAVTGQRKDGSLFAMELTVNEMWLNGHRGFAGIIRDITARRENERKLSESSALLQTVMSSTSSFVYVRDLAGRFLYVNKEYENVFGFACGEVIGKTLEEVFPADLAASNRAKDRAVTSGDPSLRLEDEVQIDDSNRTFLVVRSPLLNEHGEVYGACGVGTDITQRKQAEHIKNEFISTVSHELRTPLTSIRGSLGLLTGGVLGEMPERAKSLLAIANNNCERLVRLINDILDIEKIESGNMRFDIVTQPLLPLVKQAVDAVQDFAAQFQVKLELPSNTADALVAVDADRIVQVIINLLSNAAKFSPAGSSVQVRLARLPGFMRLSVIDHGQGIEQKFRERIFQKFAQADSSDTRQKGGTGLGLSISRAIVERHHGSIDFNSAPDADTEFYFELPLVAGAVGGATSHGRILICEDDRDIARLLGLMLSQAGLSSDIAYDAEQARRLLADGHYEAMTLDLALPREDGLSLLRWMRGQEGTRNLPVIIVSARAEEGRKKLTGGAVGIIDWIPKPIDETRLLATLREIVHGYKDNAPRVLHVEDDPDLVKVVSTMLEPDFTVEHAATLAEARRKLATECFNLILLDLLLPDGHGSELLGTLPRLNAATPVVIFSVEEANQPMIDSVRAALVKSRTSNEQLLAILHELIRQSHAGEG
jgi:PAS domain S-box-containing protein